MKSKTFYIVILSIIFFLLMYDINYISAQNIGINSTGATPDPSAMLDVSSTTGGVLVPRMTSAQRNAIASPATGLIVFDTNTASFYYYDGSAWVNLGSTGPAGATGPTGPTGAASTVAGPTGPIGATGTAGVAGATGPAGVAGATGPAGVAGATGPAGVAGATGTAGVAGATGPAGVAGATGPAGVAGATGSAGPAGATGPTGPSVTYASPLGLSGGTVSLTGASGTVNYGTGTGSAYTAAGTSGQVLISNGTGAPTWATKYETASISFGAATNLVNPYYWVASATSAYHAVYTGPSGWNFPTATAAVFNPASTTQCAMRYVVDAGSSSFRFPTATTLNSLNIIGSFNVQSNVVAVSAATNPTFTVLVVKYSPGTSSVALSSSTVATGTLLGSSAAINANPATTDNVYNISISGPISIAAGDVIGVWFDYVITSSYYLSTTGVNFYTAGSMTWKQAVQ